MQKRDTIIQELREISQVVANLPAAHPFKTPDGYFDHLAETIVAATKSGVTKEAFDLIDTISPLPTLTVPDGYFDQLADNILNRVRAASASPEEELNLVSPVLGKLDKRTPYTVPEGYFEETPANVVAGLQALEFVHAELEIISTQLAELRDKQVFRVPDGYFAELPDIILGRLKPQARLVKMNFGKRVLKYAAAAAVIGVIALSVLLVNRKPETTVATNNLQTELESSLNNISDAELNKYVEYGAVPLAEPAATQFVDVQQDMVKEMLADVSDQDLEQYLEDYGFSAEDLNN